MRIIECRVSQEYIEGGGVVIGAAGSHNDVALRLRFDDMWTGLNIYATFTDALGEQSGVILLTPSMLVSGESMTYDLPIPAVAKRFAGKSMLTLSGFSVVNGTEKDRATNTATAYFRVLKSDYTMLEGSKITPTIEEQIFSEINALGEKVEDTETDLVELREGIQDNADKISGLEEKVENIEETDPTVPDWAKQPSKPAYTAEEVGAAEKEWASTMFSMLEDDIVDHKTDTDMHLWIGDRDRWNEAAEKIDGLVIEETDPTVPDWAKKPNKPAYTAGEVGADKMGTAINRVTEHNSSSASHSDIRELIQDLTTRLNALANSSDTDLDQLSEIVAYIKANKKLIDSITTSKVNVSDIIDNLTTNASNKPLSARMGMELKRLIDAIQVPDSNVPEWAMQPNPPTYTKSDVGLGNVDNVKQYSASNPPPYPVTSVNGQSGEVSIGASDVGAMPASTKIPAKTSEITNDSGFITKAVSDLANYYSKSTTYSKDEVNALVSAIPKFAISVVSSLPTSNISATTIYLLSGGSGSNLYTEYIYVNGKWEILGSQAVDLTGYATETWVNVQLSAYVKQSDIDSAISSALATAKESGEFDGQRGTGILKVTTSPASYTTTTAGVSPIKRMAISTVLKESGVSEVLVGDCIGYSYYLYHIYYVDETYAYMDKYQSIRGATGAAGTTPVKGTDYFTSADKTEMVNAVIAALPYETWTFELEDGTTVSKEVMVGA